MNKKCIVVSLSALLVGCQSNNDVEIENLKQQVEELTAQIENQNQEPEQEEEIKVYSGDDAQKIIEEEVESEFTVDLLTLESADWSRRYGNILGFTEMNQYYMYVDDEYFDSVVDQYNSDGIFSILNAVFKYDVENNFYEVYDSEENLLGSITHRHKVATTDLVNMLNMGGYDMGFIEKDIYDEVIQKQSEVVLEQPVLLAEVRKYNGEFLYTVTGADGWYISGEDESMVNKLIETANQNNHVITEYLHLQYLPQHDFYEVTFLPLGSETKEELEFIGYLFSIQDYPYYETEEIYSAYE